MAFDPICLTEQARIHLSSLEQRTGVAQSAVLCRWAICLSLRIADPPSAVQDDDTSGMKMSWQQLGGPWSDILQAFIKQRCREDGLSLDHDTLSEQLARHLHRGLSLLDAYDIPNGPEDLIEALAELRSD